MAGQGPTVPSSAHSSPVCATRTEHRSSKNNHTQVVHKKLDVRDNWDDVIPVSADELNTVERYLSQSIDCAVRDDRKLR